MDGNSRYAVFSGFAWRFAERCGAQGVTLLVSVVLARLLDPKVYGTVALVTVFTSILQVIVNSGLGGALIQKKNADDLDFSSVFFFNIIVCALLYAIMFFAAPFIADFYEQEDLVSIIRVLCLILLIYGVKNIQQAYVSKHMLFKKFFFSTLGGTIGAAVIGITMAWHGFGVWALVFQMLFNAFVDTIILWITVGWRPKWEFSFRRLKSLFSFSWKLLAASILDTLYNNARGLIIGKTYSPDALAFYEYGDKFPALIIRNVNSSIDSVLLPALSNEQDNCERLRLITRRAIKISTYVIAPIMMGLAFTAETVVRLVLTEKWIPCVPFLRIFCITYMFYPIHTANLNAIAAQGRSDLFLKLEILKKIIGVIALLCTMWISAKAMAYSVLITSILSQVINAWPNRELLNYGYFDQIRDIIPAIMLSIMMGVCVGKISLAGVAEIVVFAIQIITGGIFYIVGSKLLKLDSFNYLWDVIRGLARKKGRN